MSQQHARPSAVSDSFERGPKISAMAMLHTEDVNRTALTN